MSDEVEAAEAAEGAEAADAADVEAAEAAELAVDDGIEVEVDDAPADEQEVNADGFAAVAGELFGGPDANQAVHETSNEGFLAEVDAEDDESEDVVEEV